MLAAALLALCGRFPSLRCVCLAGWPRPRISSYGGGIISPRGWRCPLPAFAPRFARFPPFWRPFGVAVVSNAGAVSLRPFRWCRCAYKVATRAALLCPLSLTPSDISPTSHNRYIPCHTGAPCVYLRRPRFVYACGRLAGVARWPCWPCGLVLGGYRAVLVLAACYRAGGVSSYASNPARPCGGGGVAPPPCLPCQLVKKLPANTGGLWPCGVSRPAKV